MTNFCTGRTDEEKRGEKRGEEREENEANEEPVKEKRTAGKFTVLYTSQEARNIRTQDAVST